MSTYAQVSDYQSYTELTINTASGQLQALLDQAERDIDRLLKVTMDLTDMIQGLSFSGVSSGTFTATLPVGITSYTSAPIPWNADGPTLLAGLNGMEDPHGNAIPSGSWIQPSGTYLNQFYAFGPLPGSCVFEATGAIGSARLPLLTIDDTNLHGSGPTVTQQQLVGGGLKVDPNQLELSDQQALLRATCAQAEYRDTMGYAFFAQPQFKTVSGPEFNTTGRRSMIGPRVLAELAGTDLIQRGARAAAGTRSGRTFAFQPIGDLGIPDDWRAI